MFHNIVWQAKADNIIKHNIFMVKINFCMGKFIFAWANVLLHGQMYYYMGKSIIAWANLLLHGLFYYYMGYFIIPWANLLFHGHIYYSMCNLLFPWANSYYCMRKSVFIFMRKISLRLITATYTQALTYNTFCICLALRSQVAVCLTTTRQCRAGKNAAGGVMLGQDTAL